MLLASPQKGYIACCEALSKLDQRDLLARITAPTLVIAGRHDTSTPIDASVFIRGQDPAIEHDVARCCTRSAHRAAAQLHGRRGRLPESAFERHLMDDATRRDQGTTKRRKVLGDAWVNKSAANATAFNADFLDLITRYAWGEIWTRPHFDERTRRILVIGTMVALGQWDEFRLHVRAALTEGGFTPNDIKEVLLQQAIYCGVPCREPRGQVGCRHRDSGIGTSRKSSHSAASAKVALSSAGFAAGSVSTISRIAAPISQQRLTGMKADSRKFLNLRRCDQAGHADKRTEAEREGQRLLYPALVADRGTNDEQQEHEKERAAAVTLPRARSHAIRIEPMAGRLT